MLPGLVNYQYVSYQYGKTITVYCLTNLWLNQTEILVNLTQETTYRKLFSEILKR